MYTEDVAVTSVKNTVTSELDISIRSAPAQGEIEIVVQGAVVATQLIIDDTD
jgi:hypothetical protein